MKKPSIRQGTGPGSSGDLPAYYGVPVLRVIPCNLNRLFVYWELPENALDSGSRLLLRLFESDPENTEGEEALEYEITSLSSSRYIDVPFALGEYTVELVKITAENLRHKLLVARQNLKPQPLELEAVSQVNYRLEFEAFCEAEKRRLPQSPSGGQGKKIPDLSKPASWPDSGGLNLSSWSLPGVPNP